MRHAKGGVFHEEGWGGPCGVNEVTCHVSGYGDEGLLTYDWKHFPYEDYDDFIWGERGPFHANPNERRPDILSIQTGMHTCWHASPHGLYSVGLTENNSSMVDLHIASLEKLMAAVRVAVDRPATNRTHQTIVVVVTSGSTGAANGADMDECIVKVNRAAAIAAHAQGFAVLERGELERRLVYKSLHSPNPHIGIEMHLPQPAQNIVATSLLYLLNCLNTSSELLGVKNYLETRHRGGPKPTPLHTPPNP